MPSSVIGEHLDCPPGATTEFLLPAIHEIISRLREGHSRIYIPEREPQKATGEMGHFHPYTELFLQISGIEIFQCGSQRFAACPGDITVIRPWIWHHERGWADGAQPFRMLVFMPTTTRTTILCCHAKSDTGHIVTQQPAIQLPSSAGQTAFAHSLSTITSLAQYAPGDHHAAIREIIIAALLNMAADLAQQAQKSNQVAGKVVQAEALIITMLHRSDLSLATIAEQLGCSSAYLSHLFACEKGMSMTDFIHRKRIKLAEAMLKESCLNISEVARGCGFRSSAYFSRLFRKLKGTTPRAFRQQFLGQQWA